MDSSRKEIDPSGEAPPSRVVPTFGFGFIDLLGREFNRLEEAPPSRVVSTSSSASWLTSMDLSKREIDSYEEAPPSRVVSTSSSASMSTSIDLSKRGIDPLDEAPPSRVFSTSSSASMSTSISTATTLVSSTSASTSVSTSTGVPIFASIPYEPFTILPLELTLNSKAKAIDPDGDVLIAFGSTATKLLVSSKILSIASPLFKKLFFLCEKDTPELVEIQFLDDTPSPEAVEIVFCLLHHRHECVSTDITHETLYGIALMAYRFCLITALGPWKEVWLKKGTGGGVKGMFIRHVFHDREGVREECRRVILQSMGYDDDGDDDDEEKGKEKEGEGERERERGLESIVAPKRVNGMIYMLSSSYYNL